MQKGAQKIIYLGADQSFCSALSETQIYEARFIEAAAFKYVMRITARVDRHKIGFEVCAWRWLLIAKIYGQFFAEISECPFLSRNYLFCVYMQAKHTGDVLHSRARTPPWKSAPCLNFYKHLYPNFACQLVIKAIFVTGPWWDSKFLKLLWVIREWHHVLL